MRKRDRAATASTNQPQSTHRDESACPFQPQHHHQQRAKVKVETNVCTHARTHMHTQMY